MDHDQRFKTLLKEFLREFFELFFPDWAERFDFSHVEWLEQDVFPDPPEGRRRMLDLVAKLVDRESAGEGQDWISLIHIEVESADTVAPLRRTMFRSYAHLRDKYDLPVLPLAVYLRVGLDGIGTDRYSENYGSLAVLRFSYLYVGLPALDAVEYVEKGSLGAALAALMKTPRERRPWVKAEALQRLAGSGENEQRQFLLTECVQAYLPLDDSHEQEEFERLLTKDEYREAKSMAVTFFEQGLEQGLEKGRRNMLALLIEERFGPLSPEVRQRLEEWPAAELDDLARRLVRGETLRELGLED